MNALPSRKHLRWQGYDYSKSGNYFITLALQERKPILWRAGETPSDPTKPPLSTLGKLVETSILSISSIYPGVTVDIYCIMPDHVHLIMFIAPDANGVTTSSPPVSVIVGQLKRWITRQTGKSLWQRSFYDRVIRTDKEYYAIRDYVFYNPIKIDGADDPLEWP